MSFAEKVAVLRAAFGLESSVPIPEVLRTINENMGIAGKGAPFPEQVDHQA